MPVMPQARLEAITIEPKHEYFARHALGIATGDVTVSDTIVYAPGCSTGFVLRDSHGEESRRLVGIVITYGFWKSDDTI